MYEREREIARARAAAILRQFNDPNDVPPPMNLPPELMAPNACRWKCEVTNIPRYSIDRAAMLICPGAPLQSSVWAVKGAGNYTSIFKHFLGVVYGLSSPNIPPELDIDHLRARATAASSTMIRLEMVSHGPNSSHGAGFEARMGKSIVTADRKRRNHTPGSMSWMAALKLAGVLSPVLATNPDHAARRKAAIDYFTKAGWPAGEVAAGLDALTGLADRRG